MLPIVPNQNLIIAETFAQEMYDLWVINKTQIKPNFVPLCYKLCLPLFVQFSIVGIFGFGPRLLQVKRTLMVFKLFIYNKR
jgi:hypothetical protein